MMIRSDSSFDVVVVGAGLAGLVAATDIQDAGYRVLVVEAGTEVGGRVRSHPAGDDVIELGAEFVGKQHRQLITLIKNLGLRLIKSGLKGGPIRWGGQHQRVSRIPPVSIGDSFRMAKVAKKLSGFQKRVDPTQPWKSTLAEELDAITFGEWLRSFNVSEKVRWFFEALVGGFGTSTIDEMSLLQVVWWMSAAGGVVAALSSGSGFRIAEGAQEVCVRLAARLNETPMLGTRIQRVSQDSTSVVCHGETGDLCASRALLTTPVTRTASIGFDPPLPSSQLSALTKVRFGGCAKGGAVYAESLKTRYRLAVRVGPMAFAWRRKKVCTAMTVPESSGMGKTKLAEQLDELFGGARQLRKDVVYRDWTDDALVGGTHIVFAPGDVTSTAEAIRMPHRRVDFAGAERSQWPDSMEGAVVSGHNAAERIIRALA